MPQDPWAGLPDQSFDFSGLPDQAPATSPLQRATSIGPAPPRGWYESAWDTAADYVPEPVKSAWDWIWEPKTDLPSRLMKPIAEAQYRYGESGSGLLNRLAMYGGAFDESVGNVLSGLTSPGNIGLSLATGGTNLAARAGLPTAARVLGAGERALGGATAAHGAQTIASPETSMFEKGLGAIEAVGGSLAARPRAAITPKPQPAPISPLEDLPLRPPEQIPGRPAPILDTPEPNAFAGLPDQIEPAAPAAPQQVFDPTTLQGLERTPPGTAGQTMHWSGGRRRPARPVNFMDPNTGKVKPAAQAVPGDVPIIPETQPVTNRQMFERSRQLELENRPPAPSFEEQVLGAEFQPDVKLVNEPVPETGGMTTRVETPPGAPQQPPGFADWLSRLVKEESGEFNPNIEEWGLPGRRLDSETPARRVDPETVSRENRTFIDRLADRDIQDFIVRQGRLPGYQTEVGQGILNYARDVLDDRARGIYPEGSPVEPRQAVRMAQEERAALIEPETGRPLEPYEGPYPPVREIEYGRPAPETLRPGKTLEDVEAAKRTPALQRLGKLIGEERAQQLATGEREIQFSERPQRIRGKKLAQHDIRGWAEWGDSAIKEEAIPDPSKPGLSFEQHSLADIFPNAFEIVYRDAQGNPIGVLKTDLSGKGIQTLAVDSKIGLRRGKVAFEMLKQAFDRGVNEPSGITSDLTKNLIDRVKRLVQSESGELDLEVLYKKINQLIDSISKSKVGQTIGRFIKEEGGEFDLDKMGRLLNLFEKQKRGALSADELAEATQLARESQTAAPRTAQEYFGGSPEISTGPINPPNVGATSVTQSLADRLSAQTGGQPPRGPRQPQGPQYGPAPLTPRKPSQPGFEQSVLGELWNAPRALQSIDLPGVTSAALRQARPLAFSRDWFKAWNSALSSFGSKEALDAINNRIKNSTYFRPQYEPVMNRAGQITRYRELPSIAEELGVKMTDVIHHREEAIVSSLAEKIPGYGRYVKASNRAYTGFLNDLRAVKFEQLMDGAKALGRNPEVDRVLGKKIADYVNNATGRGSLKYFGEKVNLEPISDVLGAGLYSPRALSARLAFINPYNYTKMDPFVRQQYWQSLARIGISWGAATGLASLIPGVKVSMDPNSSDFMKVRIGNTRIDPGAGFQQLMVLAHRQLPRSLGGGGITSTTETRMGKPKFTPFGQSPFVTRPGIANTWIKNQMNPSLRFIVDLWGASRREPFDLTDKTLQLALPMYATDIAEAAKGDASVAEFFAPLLSSLGIGAQTYERGSFNKPQITPFIKQVTGVDVPTMEIGR